MPTRNRMYLSMLCAIGSSVFALTGVCSLYYWQLPEPGGLFCAAAVFGMVALRIQHTEPE